MRGYFFATIDSIRLFGYTKDMRNETRTTGSETMRYTVTEIRTGRVMGTYSSRKRASRRADKLDLDYGCINYRVSAVINA